MERRDFIAQLAAGLGLLPLVSGCANGRRTIPGRITGASAQVGHWLRDGVGTDAPVSETNVQVVIVGAGISGLSAAYTLQQQGLQDFLLLDLEDRAGGNAAFGENKVSAFPLGAHYIPLPNNDLPEYLDFLRSCGVITGTDDKGLPIYNEYYLCFEPEERLYINGSWQKGLVPKHGVPVADTQQIDRFMQQMRNFRQAKGQDGLTAFAIPVNRSSADPQYTALDKLTFKAWLEQQGFRSTYLHWYCNYCCRDDFGTDYAQVSAWAGIHYFAARRGQAANANSEDVLTWPAGNGWLAGQLQQKVQPQLRLNSMVLSVKATDNGTQISYKAVATGQTHTIHAQHCLLAVPQFVAARLLGDAERQQLVKQHIQYAPWMVANITTGPLQERRGVGLCWDNVVYGSPSLGYINALHQQVKQPAANSKKVLTHYWPLCNGNTVAERKAAQQKSHAEWVEMVLQDLQRQHENIAAAVEQVDITLWGHGMVQPLPGYVHGKVRRQLAASLEGRIWFAHTDIAGISIFEEAFYQGLEAARQIAKQLT
jgi:monoamine oxidase